MTSACCTARRRRHRTVDNVGLTDAGVATVTAHLDHALAALEGALASSDSDCECQSMTAASDPALVRAIAGVLAIIGTVLARSDIVPLDE